MGALVSGLVVGGFAFLNAKNGRNASAASHGSTSTVSDANDSCSTTFTVVASVNQWGALAQELGGKCAQVTSLINSTSVEPHDYEPTPADLAKLSKADIVVINGAGYDGWAEKAQLDKSKQTIVNVGDLMGVSPPPRSMSMSMRTAMASPATTIITVPRTLTCGSAPKPYSKPRPPLRTLTPLRPVKAPIPRPPHSVIRMPGMRTMPNSSPWSTRLVPPA